ncbi:MAG TPA: HD domain-containing protein [Ktedonobacteraceae bacterium]|nr:HD domain-containing protein [Ktedonobacteraceae bacterium]
MELNSLIQTVAAYTGAAAEKPLTVAYDIAKNAHEGYRRLNGEPFINHPLAVAQILADWHAPTTVVAVGLLHDILTPNHSQMQQMEAIRYKLYPEWLPLLQAIFDLNNFIRRFEEDSRRGAGTSIGGDLSREANANTLLHDALKIVHERDAFIIKLADRFHNLQTVQHLEREQQQKIATIILNIFAPLADRMGMSMVRRELEDLSFKIIHPAYYAMLEHHCSEAKLLLELDNVANDVRQVLQSSEIHYEVNWQQFSLYTIYHRQLEESIRQGQLLSNIEPSLRLEDVGSFIIRANTTVQDCFNLVGALHTHYPSVDKQWCDFTSHPRTNGYRSIHTQVTHTNGHHVNFVVRTGAMDLVANYGYTARWHDLRIPEEYLPQMPSADRPNRGEIAVYTPKGDIKYLPQGATLLDFAYEVHTDLGDHCTGGLVNDKHATIFHMLRNGDRIEIQVTPEASPVPEWLKYASTTHALNRIRHALTLHHRNEMEKRGQRELEQELQSLGMTTNDHDVGKIMTYIALKEGLESREDVLVSIGVGRWTASRIAERIQGMRSASLIEPTLHVKILAPEYATLPYDLAHCCQPEPPVPITGYHRKNHRILVHRSECAKIRHIKSPVLVEWEHTAPEPDYMLIVEAYTKPALLSDIDNVLGSLAIEVLNFTLHSTPDGVMREARIYLGHTTSLQRDMILRELNALPFIKNVIAHHISEEKTPHLDNPYNRGPASGAGFYGRGDECQRIIGRLSREESNSSIVVWGPHQIGKTSLLYRIEELTSSEFLPVYIDLTGLAYCSTTRFLHELIHTIFELIKATSPQTAQSLTMPHFDRIKADPLGQFDRFLEKARNAVSYRPLVVILDEFQCLNDLHEDILLTHQAIFNHVHSLSQHTHRMHFILSGNGLSSEFLAQSGLASLLADAHTEKLSHLETEAAERLIRDGLSKLAEVKDEAVELLLDMTGRHPYYLQLLCYKLFDQAQEEKIAFTYEYTLRVLDEWLPKLDDSAFYHLWEGNEPADTQRNKVILSAIAQIGKDSTEVSYQSIHHALQPSISEQNLIRLLHDLTSTGVLKQNDLHYAIEVELFARWLRRYWPLELAIKEANLL